VAIKFQYNKTSLQELNRQLRIRLRALPTLKNKESALRVEVKKARDAAQSREEALEMRTAQLKSMMRLWEEFDPNLVQVDCVDIKSRKIAGVRVPELEKVSFKIQSFSLFLKPHWFADGVSILEDMATIAIEREFHMRTMELLDRARKKTTQKVNLYEKVQIPGYEEAILKIKRFMEDEENLSKAAQKIVKNRQTAEAQKNESP
jgi:V/A-type H+/Na+-transporting ATPase subunit D